MLLLTGRRSRRNYVLVSDGFGSATWVKTRSTISADTTAGPFGSTADTLIEDGTLANTHLIGQAGIVVPAGPCLVRVWAKPKERVQMRVQFGSLVNCQLDTGTIISTTGLSAAAYAASNGFTEYVMAVTSTGASTNLNIFMMVANAATYDGDNASGIYIGAVMIQRGLSRAPYRLTS